MSSWTITSHAPPTDFPHNAAVGVGTCARSGTPPETMNGKNGFYKVLGKLLTMLIGVALVFVAGIALAAVAKDSTFTAEWANMIAWFQTWAR